MKLLRRLALVISMLVCGSVTFTVAAIATDAQIAGPGLAAQGQGGGGPLPAGNYHFTTFRADYSLSAGPPAFQTISLNINGSTQRSNPLVGPSTFTSETDVSFNIFDGSTYERGCFILSSPSDFTLSSDVLSASLHTTITSATAPCADAFNITPLPLTIDVTWTGGSALLTSRSDKRYDCLTYSSVTQDANLSSNTNATATISPIFTRSFATTTAGLGTDDQRTQAAGALEAACSGPNGKGAGPGPQPAGNTQITTLIAGMAGSASDASPTNPNTNPPPPPSPPLQN